MTKCTHEGPDDFPEFLCRVCHPELISTLAQRAAADADDRVKLAAKLAAENRDRELRRTEGKLASIVRNGEPPPGSVSSKIAVSMRKKIERLRAEVAAHTET